MTIPQTYAGCDISKAHLDLCITRGEKTVFAQRFANSESGVASLMRAVVRHDTALLVYEPSGGYERGLARGLDIARRAARRINARQIRDFAKSLGLLCKTDRVDAYVLAQYAAKIQPQARPPASEKVSQLQAFVRRRAQLVEARKKEKQHLSICSCKEIAVEIEDEIKRLSEKISLLEKKIRTNIDGDENLSRRAEIIGSVCGLGPVSIATLLTEMPELGSLSGKAAANLAGVAPHPRDSGALRGRRTCWGGRKAVRDVLYMASFAACRRVPRWRALYDRLREAGKPHKLAAIAVVRHIIETINAMLRDGKMFYA